MSGVNLIDTYEPSRLTTYFSVYGAIPPVYSGPTQVLHTRAYNPGGAAAITYLEVDFKTVVTNGATLYDICIYNDEDGGYSLKIGSPSAQAPWPYVRLTPDGNTNSISVVNGTLQLTTYRLALVGNELQLDLGVAQPGIFDDQIALFAVADSVYSQPWIFTTAAVWLSGTGGTGSGTPSQLTAVWANNGEDKVTNDELRATNNVSVTNNAWNGTQVTIVGAKNEVASFNLILESGNEAISNVSVQLQTLTGPSGYTISSPPPAPNQIFTWAGPDSTPDRNIELFYVRYLQMNGMSGGYDTNLCWHDERYVPIKLRSPYRTAPPDCSTFPWLWPTRPNANKYYPEIAVPLELHPQGFSINQASNQSIWFDVYIPKDGPAGAYSGSIAILENGVVTRQLPITLTVFDFALPDVPSAKTMLFVDTYLSERLFNDQFPSAGDPNLPSVVAAYNTTWQLLHRHKISLINDPLAGQTPSDGAASALTGDLFTAANGYAGPGTNTGENVYAFGMYSAPTHLNWTKKQWWQTTTAMESWFQAHAPNVDRFIQLCDECDGKDPTYTPALVNSWASIIKDTVNNPIGSKMKTFATIDFHNAIANEPNVDVICASGFGYWNSYDSKGNFVANNIYSQTEVDQISGSLTGTKETCVYNPQRISAGGFETDDEGTDPREFAWAAYYKNAGRMFYWSADQYYSSSFAASGWNNDLFNIISTWGGAKFATDQTAPEFTNDPYAGTVVATSTSGGSNSNGDGVLLYPSYDATNASPVWSPYNAVDEQYNVPKGVFASLRLKYWRRGIQDVDYLTKANAVNPLATAQVVDCMLNAQHYSKPNALWDFRYSWEPFPYGETGKATGPLVSWSEDPDVWEGARMQLAKIILGSAEVYVCPN